MLLFLMSSAAHGSAGNIFLTSFRWNLRESKQKERPGIHFPDFWIQLEPPVWFMSTGEACSVFANCCYQ